MPDLAITYFRQVVEAIEAGRPVPNEPAGWFTARFRRYEGAALAGDAMLLDMAYGLGQPGRHGWWTMELRDRRDSALRQLHAERFPDMDAAAAARAITHMVRCGTSHPLLTEAYRTTMGIPGERRLRTILGNLLP